MTISEHNKYASEVCGDCHTSTHEEYHACAGICPKVLESVSTPTHTMRISRLLRAAATVFLQLVAVTLTL